MAFRINKIQMAIDSKRTQIQLKSDTKTVALVRDDETHT